MNKLTIGYFADGPWSHTALDRLIKEEHIEFKFIVPRADTKDQALHDYAKMYGLDYLKTQNINSPEFIEKLKKYKCDLFIENTITLYIYCCKFYVINGSHHPE